MGIRYFFLWLNEEGIKDLMTRDGDAPILAGLA